MMELLESCSTTCEMIYLLEEPEELVRDEIARLHLTGILRIVGISDSSKEGALLYDKDFIWDLSTHGRYHHENSHGCIFCRRRAELIIGTYPTKL